MILTTRHFGPLLTPASLYRKEGKMRKTGLVIMMTAAALSVSACTKSDTKQTTASTKAETTQAQTTEEGTTEEETTQAQTTEEETAGEQTQSELMGILDQIYAIKKPEFMLNSMEVDLDDEYAVSSCTGLSMDDAKKLENAVVSEPMMSSQAYSLVLVRVKDQKDTADIAQKMADGIDPRKWICVEADDLKVVSKDDMIMLFMVDSQFSFRSEDVVNAFSEVVGEPDKTYERK